MGAVAVAVVGVPWSSTVATLRSSPPPPPHTVTYLPLYSQVICAMTCISQLFNAQFKLLDLFLGRFY